MKNHGSDDHADRLISWDQSIAMSLPAPDCFVIINTIQEKTGEARQVASNS